MTTTLLTSSLLFFGFVNAEKKRELPPHIIQKFDEDGDGQLSDAEKEKAKAAHKEKMLEKYDADGDGELSDAEKEAAKAARKARKGKGKKRK